MIMTAVIYQTEYLILIFMFLSRYDQLSLRSRDDDKILSRAIEFPLEISYLILYSRELSDWLGVKSGETRLNSPEPRLAPSSGLAWRSAEGSWDAGGGDSRKIRVWSGHERWIYQSRGIIEMSLLLF